MTTTTILKEQATETFVTEDDNFHNEEYIPNEETIKVLKDSEEGRNVIGPFHNMNDFMASLLSNDDA